MDIFKNINRIMKKLKALKFRENNYYKDNREEIIKKSLLYYINLYNMK